MERKAPTCLDDILNGGAFDSLGLLANVQPAKPKTAPVQSKVRSAFQEIVDFRTKNGRAPELKASNLSEKMLAARLMSYRNNPVNAAQVKDLDCYGLLNVEKVKVTETTDATSSVGSLDDILNSSNPLLDDVDPSILKIQHVSKQSAEDRVWPDEIASRKPCEDFYNFEKLFQDAQRDIFNRKIEVTRFKSEKQVEVGDFFILSGLICFVDSIIEDTKETSARENPRLRVIFENGIETNILKRSLARALYKDPNGRRIVPDAEAVTRKLQGLSHKDKATGCIYILASETKAPALVNLKLQGRLVKIGYSSQAVEERVKNAENDPTYLEAPVKILASLDCYNLNPQKVEHLIHAFLAKQRLNMTLISSKGVAYKPTEWFMIDRDTAIAVAEHIVAGDIMNYRMDNTTGRIKKIR